METRQDIVNALIQLMSQKNLNKIYVKDIASQAKITRQTFYRYFQDKYDVINWYYDTNIETLFVSTNSVAGIRRNLITKFDFYKDHMMFFKNAYQCNDQNSLTNHEYHRIFVSLSAKITDNTGLDEIGQSQELSYALSYFIHGLLHLTIDWLKAACPLSSEDFANIVIELMPLSVKKHLKVDD